jgi:hypothetical protein
MFINWALNEIHLKIVYYGPGLSGKTTNLEFIYKKIDPKIRSELVTLKTREERTIFFDFLQLEFGKIQNKTPKFSLYTIPGQAYYAESRKVILNGVDGIVFVADSQKSRMMNNLESLYDLEVNLSDYHTTLDKFPWVIQYNKRDLKDIETVAAMQDKLNIYQVPYFEAVATSGVGVFATLKTILSTVVASIQKRKGVPV